MGQKARRRGTKAGGLEPPRVVNPPHFECVESATQGKGGADRARKDGLRVGPCLGSVPVALGVPPEGAGEFGIALTATDGALDEIDAPPQVGESGGACDGVEGGQDGGQRQCQVEGNWNAVVRQDQWPERREILEA